MFKLIKSRWKKIADNLNNTPFYWKRTASSILLKNKLETAIKCYAKGLTLDIGAGSLNYRGLIEKTGAQYKSLDFAKTKNKYQKNYNLDYIGDAQELPINDHQFDTVFCSQVLEHIPEPQKAVKEIFRVLKKNGYALISAPHLAYLHNEPYDFYRYTKHGLRYLVETAGLKIINIQPIGGIFCFFGYIASTIFLSIFYRVPILWQIAFSINLICSYFCIALDKILLTEKILPLNYLVIARK